MPVPQKLALSPQGNHRINLLIYFICRLPHPSFPDGTTKPKHLKVQLKFIGVLKIEGEKSIFSAHLEFLKLTSL